MIILGDLQLGHKDLDTWKPGPNSAGGVSVQIIFQNDTQKTCLLYTSPSPRD